jgi:hypothetical protein
MIGEQLSYDVFAFACDAFDSDLLIRENMSTLINTAER